MSTSVLNIEHGRCDPMRAINFYLKRGASEYRDQISAHKIQSLLELYDEIIRSDETMIKFKNFLYQFSHCGFWKMFL